MRRGNLLALVTVIAVVGCSADSEAPAPVEPTITTVDGVRIVENHVPQWAEGEGWRISDDPLLTLGVDTGEPHEMFTYPDAVRLPNGVIVVADRGAQQVRAFDEQGNHLWTAGRSGQGPGEFDSLGYVFPTLENGIVVFDGGSFRLTTFASDGRFLETFELTEHDDERYNARAPLESVFPDGSLLALAGARRGSEADLRPDPGKRGWRVSAALRFSPHGEEPEFVGQFDAGEIGPRLGWTVPFQARGFVRPNSRGFYYVNGRDPYINDHALDGTLRMRFRRPGEPLPVVDDDNERWLAKARENFEVAGQEWNLERVQELVYTDTMPTWRDLVVDTDDNVWVERHFGLQHSQPWYWGASAEPGFPDTNSTWDVFDQDGLWLGTVDLLPDRTVEQIGSDWVLMSGEDDDGVHRVRLYELIKDGSQP